MPLFFPIQDNFGLYIIYSLILYLALCYNIFKDIREAAASAGFRQLGGDIPRAEPAHHGTVGSRFVHGKNKRGGSDQ